MEPKNSNAPTVDNNVINVLLASLETLFRGVARMKANIKKLGSDVASTSERLERVETQRSSQPHTPQRTSPTITPDTLHQRLYPPSATNQVNLYSQS